MPGTPMPRGEAWSVFEVEACVADYLQMLTLELNGQRYNKTAHRNALIAKLDGRNKQSIEFKHCNISAVMLSLGYPYIDGYKPRGNFQSMLIDVVEAQLEFANGLHDAVQAAVLRPAAALDPAEIATSPWVPTPKAARVQEERAAYAPRFTAARRDYLAQEARNRSLGRAGELFVADLEVRRLRDAGKSKLSRRVEHVAATQGDGLGFDVLSFETDGRERLIEVKTTAFGSLTPFFVSRNELARSERDEANYQLYRLFDFRDAPRLFALPGAIASHCIVEPATFLARLTP
jgi:hypothetical protein